MSSTNASGVNASVPVSETIASSVTPTGPDSTKPSHIGRSKHKAEVTVQVEQSGSTATIPARVDLMLSTDGVNFSRKASRIAGKNVGSYSWPLSLPEAAGLVRVDFTPPTGGSASFSVQQGVIDPYEPIEALLHSWSSNAAIIGIPEVMPICRIPIGSSGKSAETYAVECADLIQSRTEQKAALGLPYRNYSIFLQNLGNGSVNTDGPDLFSHATDRVSGLQGPYTASGIAETITWTEAFATRLRTELEQRLLAFPTCLHMDVEGGTLSSTAGLPETTGWFTAALADGRYATELFDGVNTLEEFVETLWLAFHAGGYAFGPTTSTTYFNQNADGRTNGTRLIDAIVWSSQAHGLVKGFVEPMQVVFPTITRTSNYNNFSASSIANAPVDIGKLWSTRYGATRSFTHEGPVLYPLSGSSFQTAPSQKADWLSHFSITPTGNNVTDFGALYVAHATDTIEKLVADSKPMAPWLPHPGFQRYVGDSIQWGGGYTHITSVADINGASDALAANGVYESCWWQDDGLNASTWASIASTMRHYIAACVAAQASP